MVVTVKSFDNPAVKLARALSKRKDRQRERAFLLEGVRALGEAVAAGAVPRALFVCRELLGEGDAQDKLLVALNEQRDGEGRHMRVLEVTPQVMAAITETESPQGIAAILPFPDGPVVATGTPLIVIADGVRDPGNMGTLLRTALGAGATAVYTTAATVDLYNPKVVRAAMGAHFRLGVRANVGWDALDEVLADCDTIWGADAEGDLVYTEADWSVPTALIIGSEDRGITPEGRARCTEMLAIPLAGGLESLNAAVAAAVMLFEAARQRRG